MNRPRPRFVFYVVPATAVIAAVFGVVYGWIGVQALLAGGGWFGVLLVVFGFGGVALGLALWRTWRTILVRTPRP